jgi:hypothetical protein
MQLTLLLAALLFLVPSALMLGWPQHVRDRLAQWAARGFWLWPASAFLVAASLVLHSVPEPRSLAGYAGLGWLCALLSLLLVAVPARPLRAAVGPLLSGSMARLRWVGILVGAVGARLLLGGVGM